MESKIEKLDVIYGSKISSILPDRINDMIILSEKLNEIIDYLNIQPQTEEKLTGRKEGVDKGVDRGDTPVEKKKRITAVYGNEKIVWEVEEDTPEELTDKKKGIDNGVDRGDTPEEWICPKCGFDDCYPYKNSEDFGLDYCPICSELVKLTTK